MSWAEDAAATVLLVWGVVLAVVIVRDWIRGMRCPHD